MPIENGKTYEHVYAEVTGSIEVTEEITVRELKLIPVDEGVTIELDIDTHADVDNPIRPGVYRMDCMPGGVTFNFTSNIFIISQ